MGQLVGRGSDGYAVGRALRPRVGARQTEEDRFAACFAHQPFGHLNHAVVGLDAEIRVLGTLTDASLADDAQQPVSSLHASARLYHVGVVGTPVERRLDLLAGFHGLNRFSHDNAVPPLSPRAGGRLRASSGIVVRRAVRVGFNAGR